jgi:hypothetical protein
MTERSRMPVTAKLREAEWALPSSCDRITRILAFWIAATGQSAEELDAEQ